METGRIKNIVIIILLLLNIALLALTLGRRAQEARSAAAARESAAAILRETGIELDDGVIPGKMELCPMEVPRNLAAEEQTARELLGQSAQGETLGGGAYRYQGERGSVQFHSSGEFSAHFDEGAFPMNGLTAQEHGARILGMLGFQAQAVSGGVTDGAGSVTFRQTIAGVPLIGCRATLRYGGGALLQITDARRLIGDPVRSGQAVSADPATVLMGIYHGLSALGDSCRRIEQIVPAYECSVSLSGGARLTPVWYVRTDAYEYRMDVRGTGFARISE